MMAEILIKNGAVLTADGWKEPAYVLVERAPKEFWSARSILATGMTALSNSAT